MNLVFVTILAIKLLLSSAYPSDGLVEIEKQRLVKFPEESFRIEENEQKSSEAKRILEEINKINVALGYVKKQDQSLPSLLDSNQFLFPKPAYHPFHSQSISDGVLQPSIRNLNYYTYPNPSLSSKSIKSPDSKLFFYNYQHPDDREFDYEKSSVNQFNVPQNENNLREFKLIDYKVVGDYQEPYENKQDKHLEPKLRLYFVPRQLNVNEKSMDYHKNEKLIKIEKVPTIRPFSKITAEKQRPTLKPSVSNAQKYVSSTSTTTTSPSPPLLALKTPFGALFNRPGHRVTAQKVEEKPALQSVPLELPQYTQQQVRPDAVTIDNWDSESSEENDYPQDYEKHIFAGKQKPYMAEVQKEALKESGIIIQRLKVRKGGIAIAGPGGVATAGSGGTAIVGPGGYALTHPRSLTIAGPGAKIIAVPESTDLKDALQRTSSGRSYADEGEIVATGPIVYYSPDDNSQIL
ncbi:uncharacterized protein LOC129948113 isoform X1 [Eupeodes corollae]|uniref:uncharacterized protein LOC129948113 isoform X1 n=1 Tax=Eupeodes corollae TaxID=290404 RepID=UPI00248FC264|nr:uncharacterized protein LOC129948113 isoform X1 [Eupeodes corollae]